MKKMMLVATLVLAVGLGGVTRSAAADNSSVPDPGAVAVDALIVRPFGLFTTMLGSAVFVVSLPWAVPCKSVKRSADSLIRWPARTTFQRPLGDLDEIATY